MQIVTVDISETLAPLPAPVVISVAILVDKTPRQIAAFLRRKENKGVVVFPFFTGRPEDVPNFRRVRRNDVMRPYFVGNLHPVASAIAQIVTADLKAMGADVQIVANENLALPAC